MKVWAWNEGHFPCVAFGIRPLFVYVSFRFRGRAYRWSWV